MIKIGIAGSTAILVLEPDNLEKLEEGKPMRLNLRDFLPDAQNLEILLIYTPDVEFVTKQIKAPCSVNQLVDILQKAQSRPKVHRGKKKPYDVN